ncbi:MAG: hypothetical protein ABIR52_14310 [Casimicrobiaceae bacterium]
MPTARELLEQAEALMRRDRMAALAADADFPLLTDVVPDAADAADVAGAAPDAAATPVAAPLAVDIDIAMAPPASQDFAPPEPAVARLVSEHIEVAQDQHGEPSIWGVPSNGVETTTETGPDSLSPLNVDTREGAPGPANDGTPLWRDEDADGAAEIVEAAAGETGSGAEASLVEVGEDIVAPAEDFPLDATLDATRWNLMAEDIRMQVLQRIDIFTDAGLRDQLNRRLQPIVDRASADLVAAINQHVGQILREYVAEAIEREIEKWRQEPR